MLGITCAAPNGTSITSAPAALNRATDVKWVWLPVPELAIVIVFGFAFAAAMMSAKVLNWDSARTASTGDSTSTCATASNDS